MIEVSINWMRYESVNAVGSLFTTVTREAKVVFTPSTGGFVEALTTTGELTDSATGVRISPVVSSSLVRTCPESETVMSRPSSSRVRLRSQALVGASVPNQVCPTVLKDEPFSVTFSVSLMRTVPKAPTATTRVPVLTTEKSVWEAPDCRLTQGAFSEAVLVNTVPHWWLGLLLLIFLGGYLGLVPLSGMQDIGDGSLLDRLHHLILPATVGAIGGWIGFSRILRFEMLEVLNQDYVRTARAKGLTERSVVYRHALRNAIMPFVTGLSSIFLLAISGSVLFETVFSWPGMGRLFITAVNARDFPLMMALFVIGGFLGIMGLLMVDLLYGFVDPRVKYDAAK